MALKEFYWTFTQDVESTVWDIDNVPEGALHYSITEVFAEGGSIIQPDSQVKAPYGLQLVFGVTPVSGYAMGKYYKDVPESPDNPTVITTGANTVTINVTQNGGTTPAGSTF